jgi:glycosyltransferase involved in cell wall biosynthesis
MSDMGFSDPLRLLFVNSSLWNKSGWIINGGDVRLIELSKNLPENVELHVLEPHFVRSNELHAKYYCHKVHLRVGYNVFLSRLFWLLLASAHLLQLCMKIDFDCIMCHNNRADAIPVLLAGLLFRKRIVLHVWEAPLYNRHFIRTLGFGETSSMFLYAFDEIFKLVIFRRVSAAVTFTRAVAEELIALGLSKDRVFISKVGINFSDILHLSVPSKEYDCIFLGRIEERKGILDLLSVWTQIVSKGDMEKELKLAVVGTGSSLYHVIEIVKEKKLERHVDVLGDIRDEASKYCILKSSRIYVLPSWGEGFSIGILEALACGLPVVCYDLPTLVETYHDCKSVFFVPLKDTEQLKKAMTSLLSLPQKDYEFLRNEAIRKATYYRWSQIAEKEIQFLRSLAKFRQELSMTYSFA